MCAKFIVGMYLIFNAFTFGESFVSTKTANNGGSMDSNLYNITLQESTNNIRTAGELLSLVGGIGIIFYGYILFKDKK
jgi:hypothetical protein